jgi:hypothetical protein
MNDQKTMRSFVYQNAADTVADSRKGIELEFEATMLEADKIDDTEINENERIWATVNLIREVRFRLGLPHVRS